MASSLPAKAGKPGGAGGKYAELSRKFQQQGRRDQVLILVACLVAAILPLYMYGIEPAVKKLAQARSAHEAALKDIDSSAQMKNEWLVKLQQDPNETMRREIAELEVRQRQLDQISSGAAVNLVPSFDMPAVLQDVLSAAGSLRLLSMNSIPPVVILEEDKGMSLYRHGTRMVFQGSYLDAMKYLQALENLDRKFIWGTLSYEAGTYPAGTVTVEVYTLSNSKEFASG